MFVVQGSAQPSPLSPGGGRLVPPWPPAASQATPCLRSCSRGPDPGSTAWPPSPEHRAQQVGLLCPQQQQGPPACHSPGGGARGPQILFTDEKTEAQSSEGAAEGSRPQRARGLRAGLSPEGLGQEAREERGWGWPKAPYVLSPRLIAHKTQAGRARRNQSCPVRQSHGPKCSASGVGKFRSQGSPEAFLEAVAEQALDSTRQL